MMNSKTDRMLEIFFRALRGEDISVRELSHKYEVSPKTITRIINDLKAFLADHPELVGNTEFRYSHQDKCYRLTVDDFLTDKELFAVIEVLIGSRAFSKEELNTLVEKMRKLTTVGDRVRLNALIRNELYNYSEVKHDCGSIQDNLWQMSRCIMDRREIRIDYYRSDRTFVSHDLRPASILLSEMYFYLIAFPIEGDTSKPLYFRIDRIKTIVEHRKRYSDSDIPAFDEGLLRNRSMFMWPGKLRTIRFEYTGPSVQAVLDKLPTAKIIGREDDKCTLEAEVYGNGIKMWLLSQGSWIKVISPDDFVDEMKAEIESMIGKYRQQ